DIFGSCPCLARLVLLYGGRLAATLYNVPLHRSGHHGGPDGEAVAGVRRIRGRDLFAPALARIGLHPDRVICCETWKDRDVLPAMEEGLKCRGLAAVVGEATPLSLTASRRLQLAAGESGVTALIVRRWHNSPGRA